jgi:hypothetical protein
METCEFCGLWYRSRTLGRHHWTCTGHQGHLVDPGAGEADQAPSSSAGGQDVGWGAVGDKIEDDLAAELRKAGVSGSQFALVCAAVLPEGWEDIDIDSFACPTMRDSLRRAWSLLAKLHRRGRRPPAKEGAPHAGTMTRRDCTSASASACASASAVPLPVPMPVPTNDAKNTEGA